MVEAENRDFSDKPFSGVPIFLKDLGQEQAGEPSTAGSRLFTSYHAKETDNYVKKLEELGCIILGVLALLSLVSKISVMSRFMVLSICLTM